jgi:hypothetical protein
MDDSTWVTLLSVFVTGAVTWLVAYRVGYDRGHREGSSTGFRHGYFTAGGKHHA